MQREVVGAQIANLTNAFVFLCINRYTCCCLSGLRACGTWAISSDPSLLTVKQVLFDRLTKKSYLFTKSMGERLEAMNSDPRNNGFTQELQCTGRLGGLCKELMEVRRYVAKSRNFAKCCFQP